MMKRTIISCLAVLLMMVGAKADNLTVEAVEIEPGATTTVGISLTNTENNLVSFQMDLTLPEGISLNKANCILTSRVTDVDQELVIGKQGEHVYRLTSTSFNLTPIAGTQGKLITLSITASNTFAGGQATISNIVFANRNSETINIPNTNFNISVPTPASPNIVFADANVKAICVANWDTNHDGELSEAEAAAVTDLGTVFRENSTITSFNELQYFIGLTSIGDHAFENCSSLVGVTIPSSTKTIGDCSFRYCSSLTSIHIPSSVVDIDSQAFNYCPSLETITVALENSVFDSRNNCNAIIETSYNSLRVGCKNTVIPLSVLNIMTYAFTGCSNLVNISIPNSINDIGGSAFMDCSGLLSITIPSGVTDIGMLAFANCTSLRNIDLPNTITGLEVGAFEHCTSLESLTIPNGLTYLAGLSFDGCTSLSTVVIPNSVTEIGQRAFWGCNNLTSVTVNWELPLEIWDGVFSNRTNATLYVPAGTKAAYQAADYWKEFKEIVEFDESAKAENKMLVEDATIVIGSEGKMSVRLKNNQQILGFSADVHLPNGVTPKTDGSGNMIITTASRVPVTVMGNVTSDGVAHFAILTNGTPIAGNDGEIFSFEIQADDAMTAGNYEVQLTNIKLVNSELKVVMPDNDTATLAVKEAEPGDANGDGEIDVLDATLIIYYILGNYPALNLDWADINGDGEVDILDATLVMYRFLGRY